MLDRELDSVNDSARCGGGSTVFLAQESTAKVAVVRIQRPANFGVPNFGVLNFDPNPCGEVHLLMYFQMVRGQPT